MAHGMRRALPVLAAGVLFAVPSVLQPRLLLHAQTQARQRIIYASVVDESGNPAPNLTAADFQVREDKVSREVLSAEPATDPMQIALLVDNSAAAENIVRDYRQALTAFVTDMTTAPAKNRIAIITVGERPTINTEYTADQKLLTSGAGRIFAPGGSGSYLLDGIIETSDGIVKRGEPRPVIVAVTTDGPELSDRTYPHVLEKLEASGATLHVVVVGRLIVQPIDLATVLDRGTKETGGRYDNVFAASALTARMKQLADELLHQYRITYAHPDSLIPPEEVTVSTTKAGLTARGKLARTDREQSRR